MARPKSIQKHHGKEMADRLGSIPTGYLHVINAREELQRYYHRLETRKEKEAFFDEFVSVQQRDFPRAWAAIYETVDLIRQSEWYWKEKGFNTFDDFWHSLGERLFGHWAELEGVYHYAHLAAPELFNQEWDEAQQAALTAFVERLRSAPPPEASAEQGEVKGKLQFLLPEAQSEDFRAGLKAGNAGSNSQHKRFAQIRRRSPHIASKILAGDEKYVSTTPQGDIRIHWKQVAADMGIEESPASTRKRNKVTQIKNLISKLSPSELKEISQLVEKMMKGLEGG